MVRFVGYAVQSVQAYRVGLDWPGWTQFTGAKVVMDFCEEIALRKVYSCIFFALSFVLVFGGSMALLVARFVLVLVPGYEY